MASSRREPVPSQHGPTLQRSRSVVPGSVDVSQVSAKGNPPPGPRRTVATPRTEEQEAQPGSADVQKLEVERQREAPTKKKAGKPKQPARIVKGGELGRIYMTAPKDKAAAGNAQNPRVRRFVPTAATAAMSAAAEDSGTFAFIPDMYDRERLLQPGDFSVASEGGQQQLSMS